MAKYRIQVFSKERELLDTIECCVEENARIIAKRVAREDNVYKVIVDPIYTNGVEE